MRSPVLRYTLLWLIAMVPGILFGRYLKGRTDSGSEVISPKTVLLVSPEARSGGGSKESHSRKPAETVPGDEVLRVPSSAMREIEVVLLDGVTLNKEECRLLGMDEEQIRRLSAVVDQTMARLHEREKATARWIPSAGPDKLMYIPPADPAPAEKEWQEMSAEVRDIAGPDLADLLHFRLTDGYSPSRFSNWGKGMLNVATAGFGTLHRFIRMTPLSDGSWSYNVVDLLPSTVKDTPINEATVREIGKSRGIDQSNTYGSAKELERFSHLPSP